MTDQQRITMLEAQLAEQEQALQHARAERDALRRRDAENAEIIGDLIARMVHDLNNLNTKIRSSSSAITHALDDLRGIFATILLRLTPEEQQAFLDLLERACHQKTHAAERVSLREERRLRRALNAELEAQQLGGVAEMSDILVDMGIYADIRPFLPVLRHDRQEDLLQAVYGLAGLRDVAQWNLNPTFGRIAHISHALRHMIVALLEHRAQETRIVPGLEQVLGLFADVLTRRRITVRARYDDLPPICCYAGLEIVWAALIENALEAIEKDGTLDIEVTQDGSAVLVRIIDSGRGIPESLRATVFERNATSKPSGADVHGAGLYIARKIVTNHHGRITFETQPGRTAFSVRLPVRRNIDN